MLYETGNKVYDSGVASQAIWSSLEAAGCADKTGEEVFECYRDAIASGRIKDPAEDENAAIVNAMQACKNGGVASCTYLMMQGALTDSPCFKDQIESWHRNVRCDCDEAKCYERRELTPRQRGRQQRGGLSPLAMGALAVGGAGLLWLVWRRRP